MKASPACIDLICRFEGFRAQPYLCPAGKASIGYGSTVYADGTPVQMTDPALTRKAAEKLLADTLGQYEDAVNQNVTQPLAQGQFDALTDFAYNCGVGNFRASTLLRKVNLRDFAGAAKEFGRWVNGGGMVLPGLVKRREAERQLFEALA